MKKSGVLIIPSNKNGDTLLNVLSIVFDKETKKKHKFPDIKKITFLETDDVNESDPKIKLNEEYLSQPDAYKKMLNILGLKGMEIRAKELVDYVKDIPEIIMSAINETGDQDQIVLDLTNGTKEITGTLYTAGTICGIEKMIYIQVKRDQDGKFYHLNEEKDKTDLYDLTTFKALDDIQILASMNGMEFIMYKKKIDELRNRKNTDFFNDLCVRLDNAVGYYFDGSESGIPQAIQNIGIMNEHLMRAVIRSFEPIWRENEKDQNRRLKPNVLRESQEWYLNQEQSVREGKLKDTKKWEDYNMLFRTAPNFCNYFYMEKVYRNMVSHGLKQELKKEDAKAAITIMFRMIDGLLESSLSEEIFADD